MRQLRPETVTTMASEVPTEGAGRTNSRLPYAVSEQPMANLMIF